jgi:thioester reductase-like protein
LKPSAPDHLLLTGGTGLLGSYLVRDLLLAGRPLALVVRRDRKRSATSRVEAIVQQWEDSLGRSLPRPVVFEGDLNEPLCGLGEEERHWIHWNCGELLNNAA